MFFRKPELRQVLDRVQDAALVRERRVEVVLLARLVDADALEDEVLRVPGPVWKSNFGRPTPSMRRRPRNCICSMAWRLTKVSAIILT